MTPPVRVRGLVHAYEHDPVLAIPDLELTPGRYHLSGPNGAGKTTLLRILATLTRPSQGEVRLAGHRLPDQAEAARAALGFAGHEPSLHPSLPARRALALHARLHGLDPARVDGALEAWGLAGLEGERVASLSHGQRHRLDLARALLHEPEVVLLDEPASGLDEAARRRLDEELAAREPVLVVVAAPEQAPVPVDDRIRLTGGRLEGTP